jgi:hypothetical protein
MIKLTNMQILEIETLSMHGCGVDTIAYHLGMTPGAFRDLADADERIRDAMLIGRHRGIAQVAKSLFASATSGKDSGVDERLRKLGVEDTDLATMRAAFAVFMKVHVASLGPHEITPLDLNTSWVMIP